MNKILIANRGEIACRIIRTARNMGIATVAVYSEADRDALHVAMADEACCIGPAPSQESYLRVDKVLEVVRQTGADAVHPGYGFLSENAAFAEACTAAGIRFIGPPASAIRAMGSKSEAKALMEQAGVPLTPGYHGEDQDDSLLAREAQCIGYPVLLKASAGGGGKGMRVVESAREFDAALAGARREAKAAFGDTRMLIERYVSRPRHVEVQVFCDSKGNALYLHERDCSIQRRHQKVVEEAPAPGLSTALRRQMGEAAVRAAQAVDYVGAGTVEFLLEGEQFYFMEMNTRLQVEHPVTEAITGLDLVEWQIRVAGGEALPFGQEQIARNGHAIEVRIYAEDASQDFLPCPGPLHAVRFPEQFAGIRVDSGVRDGDEVSAHYDPMLAKLIAWGEDRETARQRLLNALQHSLIAGTRTNLRYLQAIIAQPEFADARLSTRYLEEYPPPAIQTDQVRCDEASLLAALYLRLHSEQQEPAGCEPASPWNRPSGWRLNMAPQHLVRLQAGNGPVNVELSLAGNSGQATINKQTFQVSARLAAVGMSAELNGHRYTVQALLHHQQLVILHAGRQWQYELANPDQELSATDDPGSLAAPTSGTIVTLNAQAGGSVSAGDALLVMEAMKMEHTVRAPFDGILTAFCVEAGQIVSEGEQLVELLASDTEAS